MRQLKIVKQITNRESESLKKTFRKLKVESHSEGSRTSNRTRRGSNGSEKLTKANLVCGFGCKQYQHCGLRWGLITRKCGLIKAGKRFDPTALFNFISMCLVIMHHLARGR